MNHRIFTSESVTEGHPDKVCDQISDAVLDAVLEQDPMGRVACECVTNTGFVLVTGEMIAVGSLLVVAIGTNLLGVTKVKVMNLVPAMFFPIALCPLYELFFV